eukprot:g19.t1
MPIGNSKIILFIPQKLNLPLGLVISLKMLPSYAPDVNMEVSTRDALLEKVSTLAKETEDYTNQLLELSNRIKGLLPAVVEESTPRLSTFGVTNGFGSDSAVEEDEVVLDVVESKDGDFKKERRRTSSEDINHNAFLAKFLAPDERRLLDKVVRRFNLNPKKGISSLIGRDLSTGKRFRGKEGKVLRYVSEAQLRGKEDRVVAQFLLETHGLSKQKVGDWLGMADPCNVEQLKQYALLIDFTGRSFEKSIRAFLSRFRLPGESQKIERVLEAFAISWLCANPYVPKLDSSVSSTEGKDGGDKIEENIDDNDDDDDNSRTYVNNVFKDAEPVVVTAFATVMLNVDAHSGRVKPKNQMTLKSFTNMLRDTVTDENFVSSLFESIKTKGILKTQETRADVGGNLFTEPEKCGYLWKRSGGPWQRWLKRYFILSDSILYYFLNAEDVDIRGFITLNYVRIVKQPGHLKKAMILPKEGLSIVKTAKFTKSGGLSLGNHSQIYLRADSRQVMEEWIDVLTSAINHVSVAHTRDEIESNGLRKSLRMSGEFAGALQVQQNSLKTGFLEELEKQNQVRDKQRDSIQIVLKTGSQITGLSPKTMKVKS